MRAFFMACAANTPFVTKREKARGGINARIKRRGHEKTLARIPPVNTAVVRVPQLRGIGDQ